MVGVFPAVLVIPVRGLVIIHADEPVRTPGFPLHVFEADHDFFAIQDMDKSLAFCER